MYIWGRGNWGVWGGGGLLVCPCNLHVQRPKITCLVINALTVMQLFVQAGSLENLIAHIGDKMRFFYDFFFWGGGAGMAFLFFEAISASFFDSLNWGHSWILLRNWHCEKAKAGRKAGRGEGDLTVSQLRYFGLASFFKLKQEKRDCLASLWQTFLSVHQAKQEVCVRSCFPALSDTATLAMQNSGMAPWESTSLQLQRSYLGQQQHLGKDSCQRSDPQLFKHCEKGGVWSCWTSSVLCTCVTSPWRSE